MITVRLDATEKVVIRCTEHVRDAQLVGPAAACCVTAASRDMCGTAVSGRAHARPRRCGVLDARNDNSTEYIL